MLRNAVWGVSFPVKCITKVYGSSYNVISVNKRGVGGGQISGTQEIVTDREHRYVMMKNFNTT